MEPNPFLSSFPSGVPATGPPTLRSSAELRRLHEKCRSRTDPNTFYLTVDSRPEPKIVFSHNSQAHLGAKELSYSAFFTSIHPFWLPLYTEMREYTYRLISPLTEEDTIKNLVLSANVPLRTKSGAYYWYSQVSFVGSFDERGLMVEYLNEFHRLAKFDRMVPAPPQLFFRGDKVEHYDSEIKEVLGRSVEQSLKQALTPANFRLLQAYRRAAAYGHGSSREAIADYLGLSLQALDKIVVRLLAQARLAFPAATLSTVMRLAVFLNQMFGNPLEHAN